MNPTTHNQQPTTNKKMIPQKRHHFIDWMKAVGMFLIVFGHVVGQPFAPFSPIYPKQLGVAFFVFVLGWSLANEKRKPVQVIFNRLLPIYFWGISIAIVLSIIAWIIKNDLNLSNYMPFVLGINVFVNYFPANPTTWYIGTYLHLLLLWAFFFSRIQVKLWMLPITFFIEIVIRALIINADKEMIAYMILTNWLSIFLLGMLLKNKSDEQNLKRLLLYIGSLLLVLLVWGRVTDSMQFIQTFPFLKPQGQLDINSTLILSFCISALYLCYTFLVFEVCRRLPGIQLIRFFSENTLIIFIVHLPLIFYLSPAIYSFLPNVFLKKTIMIIVAYLGLAQLSAILQKIVNLKDMRKILWENVTTYFKTINN